MVRKSKTEIKLEDPSSCDSVQDNVDPLSDLDKKIKDLQQNLVKLIGQRDAILEKRTRPSSSNGDEGSSRLGNQNNYTSGFYLPDNEDDEAADDFPFPADDSDSSSIDEFIEPPKPAKKPRKKYKKREPKKKKVEQEELKATVKTEAPDDSFINPEFVENVTCDPELPWELDESQKKPTPDTSVNSSAIQDTDHTNEGPGPYFCKICGKEFAEAITLKRHMGIHRDDLNFPCWLCGKGFQTEDKVNKHIQYKHISNAYHKKKSTFNEKDLTCSVCNKTFATKITLRDHQWMHSDVKPFPCELCPKSFASKSKLGQHMWSHGKENPFECTACEKTFSNKNHYVRHLQTQHHEKNVVCEHCGKKFSAPQQYALHLKTHDDTKIFECGVCKKVFNSQQKLSQHIPNHNQDRCFMCDICGKGYTTKRYLAAHTPKHAESRFLCDICGKSFSLDLALRAHRKLHGCEKDQTCEICNKTFATPRYLVKHMRTHTDEKGFACRICDKAFTTGDYLKTHIAKCHVVKNESFGCDVCKREFSRRSSLNQHVKAGKCCTEVNDFHVMFDGKPFFEA